MILDTTVIFDLIRGDDSLVEKIRKLEENNIPFWTTSISVFEIWQGMEEETEEKKEKIQALLNSLGIFFFDIDCAKEAGLIHSSLREKGKTIDPEDSMIAGIAKVHGEKILTRNVAHFNRVKSVEIETY